MVNSVSMNLAYSLLFDELKCKLTRNLMFIEELYSETTSLAPGFVYTNDVSG